jgi:hypothetical protein
VGLLNTPSPADLFIHSSGGELLPATLWHSVPEVRHFYKPSPLHTCCGASPQPPSPQACLFTVYVGKCPSPFLWSSGRPAIFGTCLFSVACLLFSIFCCCYFYFLWDRGGSVQGAMMFYPRCGCGSTTAAYLITCWSVSPKQVRSQCLVAWELSCFLCISWRGEAMCGLGCRGVRVLPLLVGFSCQLCLQHLGKTFTLRNTC